MALAMAGLLSTGMNAQVQHQLWGMTTRGGLNNDGVIFKTDASGNNLMVKQNFMISGANNTDAYGSLMQASDGKLYGMTWYGGSGGQGSIFSFDPATSIYLTLHDFVGQADGRYPQGNGLVQVGGMLYGMTTGGGTADKGVLFQIDPVTKTYTKKADFVGSNGDSPYGCLVHATDGHLYGMTYFGGSDDDGVIFDFDPVSGGFILRGSFQGTSGKFPYGSMVQANDGKLYGMTSQGGANGYGIIFQFNPQSNGLINLWDFDMTSGAQPNGSLIQATNGKLYGLTLAGGTNSAGVLFQISPASPSLYTVLFNFDSTPNGDSPLGSLLQATDGNLYGLTSMGGSTGGPMSLGSMFQYNLVTNTFTNKFEFDATSGSNPENTNLIEIPVTITTGSVNAANCVGSMIQVPFAIAGAYDPGNVFTAQLSDAAGSFAAPVTIGTISYTMAGSITAVIPAATPPGNAYRIRVIANNPVVTGSDNGSNISINALPGTGTTLSGATITASQAGAGYQWLNCAGNTHINGETGKSFTATANGSYAVIVTMNGNGCIDTSACVAVSHIGIDEIIGDNRFTISPNPSADHITVVVPANATLEMLDSKGQVIKTIRDPGLKITIGLENLSPGIYFLKATTGAESLTRKFIKE